MLQLECQARPQSFPPLSTDLRPGGGVGSKQVGGFLWEWSLSVLIATLKKCCYYLFDRKGNLGQSPLVGCGPTLDSFPVPTSQSLSACDRRMELSRRKEGLEHRARSLRCGRSTCEQESPPPHPLWLLNRPDGTTLVCPF